MKNLLITYENADPKVDYTRSLEKQLEVQRALEAAGIFNGNQFKTNTSYGHKPRSPTLEFTQVQYRFRNSVQLPPQSRIEEILTGLGVSVELINDREEVVTQ